MATLAQELREMHTMFEEAKALDKQAKEIRMEAKEREARLLERMAEEEVDSQATNGTVYTPASTIYHTIQDEAAFLAWAESAAEQLVEVKARSDLMNQLVRERLDNGEELPPGVGFYTRDYISKTAR